MQLEDSVEEVENTEADVQPESAEPAQAEEPSVESAVETQQAEETHRPGDFVEPKTSTTTEPTNFSRFDNLSKALGDLPDEPSEKLLESITDKHVETLPTEAKVMLKHILSERKREQERNKAAQEVAKQGIENERKKLHAEARELIRNRAKLSQIFTSDEVKNLLSKAKKTDRELPDPYTPEGMQARIEREAAKNFQQFIDPITKSAQRAQAESAYNDFVVTHPKMENKKFKSAVAQIVKSRKAAGVPVTLSDAHDLVEHQWMVQESKNRKEKERRRRAESSRKISRTSVSSDPSNGPDIPEWVATKGYKGRRGAAAKYLFLKDNPKIHARVKAKQGRA